MTGKTQTIKEKLEIIQKRTGLTQTKLAEKFGVSFVAFNGWWTEKSVPRQKMQIAINELYLEVTGQKTIPEKELLAKKEALSRKRASHISVITEILENSDIRDQFILKLTYNSNKIEGSTLTEPDTAAIIFDNVALPNKSLTEQIEAKNHQTAINFLFDHVSRKEKIDEKFLVKLHSILMNGVRSDAGQYRNHAIRILGVDLPTANYASIPKLIFGLAEKIEKQTDDIIASSAQIHSEFEKIHPFSDGNGRIGRLLMNAMFLQKNFPPAIIQETEKRLYYTYLYRSQTLEDSSQLEDFLCAAVMNGFNILERLDVM